MDKERKAAMQGNAKAAYIKHQQHNFTELFQFARLKLILLLGWLSLIFF